MGGRIDELEKNINGLLEQAGVEDPAAAAAASASKPAATASATDTK